MEYEMDEKELIRSLADRFNPSISRNQGLSGTRICIRINKLEGYEQGVRAYEAVLTGTHPLTGEPVEKYNIRLQLTLDVLQAESEALNLHGQFCLEFYAVLQDGRRLFLRKTPIELSCERNRPRIRYSFKRTGRFTQVNLQTNCWGNARGKLWVRYDGQLQRLDLPEEDTRTVRFYLMTTGEPAFICCEPSIDIRKG